MEPASQPGLVKLSVDGLHSTVCNEEWDNNDARVYCHTLGYNFGRAFGTWYQSSQVPRIVSNVTCSGNEASIADCPFSTAAASNCRYSQNAKVFCYTKQQGGLGAETDVAQYDSCCVRTVLIYMIVDSIDKFSI